MDLKKKMQEAEAFLYEIPKFTKKNPLSHTRRLLHALGDPQEGMRVIHVAGSNGKGSVCSFLFHMLREDGHAVGLFTSPHLADIRERFQTGDGLCSRKDFLKAFDRVKQEAEQMQKAGEAYPTFFEFLYAMGMLLFVWARVEIAVIETGLGGRLDCTNIVKKPLLTVITSISLEHTEYLGDTIPEIAAEKAGILKEGVPAVIDAGNPQAAEVIAARAQRLHVPLVKIGEHDVTGVKLTDQGIYFTLHTKYDRGTGWQIPFHGLYQARNAALAITAYRMLTDGRPEKEKQIRQGLAASRWPGRMQEVRKNVFLDGAHNPDGIRVFLESAAEICRKDGNLHPLLLFSMVRDKDYRESVRLLCEQMEWDYVIVSHIPSERGLAPETLLSEFRKYRATDTQAEPDCRKALQKLSAMQKEGQKLFCTGSLYFIGELLKDLQERQDKDD